MVKVFDKNGLKMRHEYLWWFILYLLTISPCNYSLLCNGMLASRAWPFKASPRRHLERYWSGDDNPPYISEQSSVLWRVWCGLFAFTCNLLPTCGRSRLLSLITRLTTSHCSYRTVTFMAAAMSCWQRLGPVQQRGPALATSRRVKLPLIQLPPS